MVYVVNFKIRFHKFQVVYLLYELIHIMVDYCNNKHYPYFFCFNFFISIFQYNKYILNVIINLEFKIIINCLYYFLL